ncbi:MAG: DNA-binding protein Alba [Candidatus Bathyarchaeota archaeon]|nr:DNA-binding protein Alba [Candidatus Bathyarchaeota archaeon]
MSKESNTVFIGNKPIMNYVLASVTLFGTGNAKEIIFKARGRAITTAVDVAEIVKRRFMENVKITNVSIGTEEIPNQEGKTRPVSTIEINMTKK